MKSSTSSLGQRWHDLPRWAPPAAGALVLILLDALSLTGLVSDTIVFSVMAAFVLLAAIFGVMLHGNEAEDRRADLPLTLLAVYAVLFVAKAGFLVEAIAVLLWPALILGSGYVLTQDRSWWWIAAGAVFVFLFNLVVFYANVRPH